MRTGILFVVFLIQFSIFAQKDSVIFFSKILKYKNNLYLIKKDRKVHLDIIKIDSNYKTDRREYPGLHINKRNPFPFKWNMLDSCIFTISDYSSNEFVFFLFRYRPVNSIFGEKLNIDTAEVAKSVAQGTFFEDYKEIIAKSHKIFRKHTVTSIAYLNGRIHGRKRCKRADDIQFDFYFDKKEQYNQTLYTFDTYLYILEDSILSLGKYKLGYSTKIDFFVGGQRESDWQETKRFYFPVSSEFHVIRQDTNIYLLTTKEVYQHKNDTIVKIGRITQKPSTRIKKINNYYILDTDNNNQVLLFPPLYYIEEEESELRINTVKKNSKVYKKLKKIVKSCKCKKFYVL